MKIIPKTNEWKLICNNRQKGKLHGIIYKQKKFHLSLQSGEQEKGFRLLLKICHLAVLIFMISNRL